MAGIRDVGDVWKNVKEVDLRPIMQSAVQPVRIALVGRPESGVQILAARLRTDPYRPAQVTATPLVIAEPPFQQDLSAAEVIIVVIAATARDGGPEQQCAARWQRAGSRVITVVNVEPGAAGEVLPASSFWVSGPFLDGSLNDLAFLEGELVPAVLEAMPERGVALARQLPLFRATVARRMIEEVSMANATYSLTTGLAGTIPLLNIPLNVTDMVVLTKAQAFLVYRLGLSLGLSTRWQDYVREFGSVIGGGFMWRQLARTLVGLVPWLGIVPKVVVAYSGSYVVGNVIWHWYLTGRHLSTVQLRAVYRQAIQAGKSQATKMIAGIKRPRRRQLPAPRALPARPARYCRFCGKELAPGATACAYCQAPVTAAPRLPAPASGSVPAPREAMRRLKRTRLPAWSPWRRAR